MISVTVKLSSTSPKITESTRSCVFVKITPIMGIVLPIVGICWNDKVQRSKFELCRLSFWSGRTAEGALGRDSVCAHEKTTHHPCGSCVRICGGHERDVQGTEVPCDRARNDGRAHRRLRR